jgi:hypothetical protein
LVRVSDNGWITSELFLERGKMFVKNLPKDDPCPHVLLLDGHKIHVFNLSLLELMKENNIARFIRALLWPDLHESSFAGGVAGTAVSTSTIVVLVVEISGALPAVSAVTDGRNPSSKAGSSVDQRARLGGVPSPYKSMSQNNSLSPSRVFCR